MVNRSCLGQIVVWIILALGLLNASWAAAITKNTNVIHIRIKDEGKTVNVIFDLTAPVDYQIKTNDPQHLTLTLNSAKLRFPLPSLPANPVIANYHLNANVPTDLQFDFTLSTAAKTKVYALPPTGDYSDRLVLELMPISSANDAVAEKAVSKLSVTPAETKATPLNKPIKPIKISKPASHPFTVVIDPGHGGMDPGAVGPSGYQEKNVVLAISKKLQQILQKQGYKAVLTRDRDFFIPLRERLAIARRYKPDLFIAVHADASFNGSGANGASVFALSERGATSEMARWLATKENQSELVDGVFVNKDQMLRSVLLDLSQSHTIGVSLSMGQLMLQKLSSITHLHYARVEQAAFVVLKSPDIPSLLVETGYITNPRQEQQLISPQYQEQLAATMAQGISAYFGHHLQT